MERYHVDQAEAAQAAQSTDSNRMTRRALLRRGAELGVAAGAAALALSLPELGRRTEADSLYPKFHAEQFKSVWDYWDLGILNGKAGNRGWTFGPVVPGTDGVLALDGRTVQFFQKGVMQLNHPTGNPATDPDAVQMGNLISEMVTGGIQVGPESYRHVDPSTHPISGDDGQNQGAVTYANFTDQWNPGNYDIAPEFQRFIKDTYGAPSNWVRLIGLPSTKPEWIETVIDGKPQKVMAQLFERRALTFNPNNSSQWQVEMNNAGVHYAMFRNVWNN